MYDSLHPVLQTKIDKDEVKSTKFHLDSTWSFDRCIWICKTINSLGVPLGEVVTGSKWERSVLGMSSKQEDIKARQNSVPLVVDAQKIFEKDTKHFQCFVLTLQWLFWFSFLTSSHHFFSALIILNQNLIMASTRCSHCMVFLIQGVLTESLIEL